MQARKIEFEPIRPITVAEYHRMGKLGIIKPDERVELLDGRLIPMPPIGPDHDYTVRRLTVAFVQSFAGRASVGVQGPITLDDISEPQPDLMLNALPDERYALAHPTPDEVLLVVEVSKTSLSFDRGAKLRAYARRRVHEYWIVDLVHDCIDVFRKPRRERFAEHRLAQRGESIAPATFPQAAIAVDDILPPRTR